MFIVRGILPRASPESVNGKCERVRDAISPTHNLFTLLLQQTEVGTVDTRGSLSIELINRLSEYGLDSADDQVANFMIFSLQTDKMLPKLKV